MARIHVKLQDGRTGTIEQKDFNPETMTMDYNLPQKAVKSLPGVGATLGSVGGGILGGAAGSVVPGAGTLGGAVLGGSGGGAIGGGAGYALRDLLGPLVGLPQTESPQALKEAGGAVGTGAATGALGELLGGLGGKVLPPVFSKVKGFLPKTIQKSAQANMEIVGKEIENLLTKNKGKTISVAKSMNELAKLKEKYISAEAPKAVKMIDEVMDRLGSGEIPVGKAFNIKSIMGSETFKESGEELIRRGQGQAGITARKIAGGDIGTELGKTVEGFPELSKQYGQLSKFSSQMSSPTSGYGKAFIPGVIASPLGFGISAPVTAGTALLSMPWTRFLLQRLLSNTLKTGGGLIKATPALNSLLGPQQ